MPKLTDTQRTLLTLGAHRENGSLLPSSEPMTGKTAQITKAIGQLIKRGLAAEIETGEPDRVWRKESDTSFGVVISEGGKRAIGVPESEAPRPTAAAAGVASTGTPAATALKNQQADSKQAKVLDLLAREGGASIGELTQATGWLPHTTRAALTGFRKRGVIIEKANIDGVTRYTATRGASA